MGSSMPPLVERMSARIRSNRGLSYTTFVERISARLKSNKQIDDVAKGRNLAGVFEIDH